MRKLGLFAVILGFLWAPSLSADPHSDRPYKGNDLVADCQPQTPHAYAKCLAFVEGVVYGVQADEAMRGGDAVYFRIPEGVTIGQAVSIVAKYLSEHPEQRHLDAGMLVIKALAAFPVKGVYAELVERKEVLNRSDAIRLLSIIVQT